uniref:EXPERA domain-containing protein n=1 Tax=Paramoeba aestuarina TaxID=180227 RepID=A0A7S4P8S3_9EUKA|mmetsp:Transcript_38181/g.60424  ORF Transcript_38181/g.60424 Transcript_38181/m.60424 type:complete len:237 (+) Transcript_38181:51-761(+)
MLKVGIEATGGVLAGIVVVLWLSISLFIRNSNRHLQKIDVVTFCWLTMTAMTGVWEWAYLHYHDDVVADAQTFIATNTHVWTNYYDISYIVPWRFSPIMYTEYAAYADRAYMSTHDPLAQIVELSHLLYCSVFAALAITRKSVGDTYLYLIFMVLALGTQSMQCLMYVSNYFVETTEPHHANFITESFPAGQYWEKRPFFYVNIFWTGMGLVVIFIEVILGKWRHTQNNDKKKKKN